MRAIIWVAVSTKAQVSEGKESLDIQEKEALAICVKYNWEVVDILRVPGHSRRYIDIHKLAEHAAKTEGIMAFHDLLDHFEKEDFDVLVVRDGDRFARTQALHAYIVESTIAIGAKIYSLADGIVDDKNFRMSIAMGGYRAAGEVDGLVKKREIGFNARFKRGLPVNSNVVSSHRIIRDPNSGRATHIEVDESKRQEYADLATLVLEGVPFPAIEVEMFNRFGYAGKGGKPHQPQRYYRILRTPSFWGHLSRGHKSKSKGMWIFEDGHPIPENVEIVYNAFEAMYTGALARNVIAEIQRRAEITGRRSPNNSYKFSGLIICGACAHGMSYSVKGNYVGLRCNSYNSKINPSTPQCSHKRMLNERKAIKQIRKMIFDVLQADSVRVLTHDIEPIDYSETLTTVESQIREIEKEILVMITQQSKADSAVQDAYNESIRNAGSRLETLKARREEVRQQIASTLSASQQEKNAILEIRHLGKTFWELPNNEINQLLRQLLGDYRFVALHGQVIGIAISNYIRKLK